VTQQLLHRWVAGQDDRFDVLDGETVAGVRTTVLVRSTTGRQVALCYTSEVLGAEAWQQQHAALERADVAGVWLFPPRAWYFTAPDAQPAPADEDAQGLIVDTRLFKTMRREGSWPLIMNIEREEVANLIVPGKAIAGRLGLCRPPFVEDVLHVIVSPFTNCTLCKDGIATPAVNKWHLEKIRGGYRRRVNRVRRVRRPATRRLVGTHSGSPGARAVHPTHDQLGGVRAARQAQPVAKSRPAPIALAERRQLPRHSALAGQPIDGNPQTSSQLAGPQRRP
jgi:hypothetical protein